MKLSICTVVFLFCIHVHAALLTNSVVVPKVLSPTNSVVMPKVVLPVSTKKEGTLAMTVSEAKRETGKIIDEWVKMYGVNYRAEIVGPELMAVMQNELKKRSPIPLTISCIFLVNRDGKSNVDFDLAGLSSEFPPEMLTMASNAIKSSESGRIMERLSPNLLKSASQMFMSKEDFALINVNEDIIHVEVNQVNEIFFRNRVISTLRLQVGRKTRTIDALDFVFTDNKRMHVDMKYISLKVPGSDKPINMLSDVTFSHDQVFIILPPKFTVFYKQYVFTK
jgi:hypothetical protein